MANIATYFEEALAEEIEAKKIELDGHVFDSKAEAKYYELLKQKQANEEILFLRLQPRYEL